MAETKSYDSWLDSGATIRVCNDKKFFLSYKEETEGQMVLMGNNNAAMVAGKRVVESNFTSKKKVTLYMSFMHLLLGRILFLVIVCVSMGLRLCLRVILVLSQRIDYLLGKSILVMECTKSALIIMIST